MHIPPQPPRDWKQQSDEEFYLPRRCICQGRTGFSSCSQSCHCLEIVPLSSWCSVFLELLSGNQETVRLGFDSVIATRITVSAGLAEREARTVHAHCIHLRDSHMLACSSLGNGKLQNSWLPEHNLSLSLRSMVDFGTVG